MTILDGFRFGLGFILSGVVVGFVMSILACVVLIATWVGETLNGK